MTFFTADKDAVIKGIYPTLDALSRDINVNYFRLERAYEKGEYIEGTELTIDLAFGDDEVLSQIANES